MLKRISYLLLLLLISGIVSAHPWKPNHYVIIDTDGGFDDYRAITIMLASPEVRVMGITVSNGVLDAHDTYFKVKSLLKDLYHEGIPVGLNYDNAAISNNCQPALKFEWGAGFAFSDSIISAIDLISNLLTKSNEKIELICMGSLNIAANMVKNTSNYKREIKRILWTGNCEYLGDNFNYNTDKKAFEFIQEQKIPLELITGEIVNFDYSSESKEALGKLSNQYSKKLIASLTDNNASPFADKCFDESAALFIHFPQLYSSDTIDAIIRYKIDPTISSERIRDCFTKILSGLTINQNQVFQSFPIDTSFYADDVQRIMTETIRKFGNDEWASCVITNELHRHLGVYAIIGAKMGIRAREYFGIGADELKIESFAGTTPPFSCMNDGLQVSTGGTLGHGLITVASDLQKEPKATFAYLDKRITVSLKGEYRKKMENEIKEISAIYGLDSNVYWELVRIAALNYWAEWDRHEIFDITTD